MSDAVSHLMDSSHNTFCFPLWAPGLANQVEEGVGGFIDKKPRNT